MNTAPRLLRCPRCQEERPREEFRVVAHSVYPAIDTGWALPIIVLRHRPCGAFIYKPDVAQAVKVQ